MNISVEHAGNRQDWFDAAPHEDDRDFWLHLVWGDAGLDDRTNSIGIQGKRPLDFDRARAWVRANISSDDFNRARLLDALDRMEADPALYFSASF